MVRKALALLMMVAVVGIALGAVGLWIPGLVGADGHSADRSFPDGNSVGAGGELKVQITARDYGQGARVTERLPEGFEYQFSSLATSRVAVDGDDPRNVTFAVVFESSPYTFTYTVTVSDVADTYEFSGTILDLQLQGDQAEDYRTVDGDKEVIVVASDTPMPTASRAFSAGHGDDGRPSDGDHHRQRVRGQWVGGGNAAYRVHVHRQRLRQRECVSERADGDVHPAGRRGDGDGVYLHRDGIRYDGAL